MSAIENATVTATTVENNVPAASPVPARLPLQVVIAHLHDGTITKLNAETMSAALQIYRGRIAAARPERPFIAMSDLHWKVELTYKGGRVEVMTISNGEKVLARAAGVANLTRRQEAAKSGQNAAPVAATA